MFTNNLVMFSFRSLVKILVGDQLQQRSFEAFHMVIPEPEHQDHIQHSLESSSVDHGLDRADLKTEFVKQSSVPSLDFVLDPFVKIRIVDMLKCTIHTRFGFDIGFHEQQIKTSLLYFYVYQMCSIYIHASYLKQTYFDMSIHECLGKFRFPIEKFKFDKIHVLVFGKNDKTQKQFKLLDI